MANIGEFALFDGNIIKTEKAQLSVASSAVLYGLSVYSVFFGKLSPDGLLLFRLDEHIKRLRFSSQIIGFTDVDKILSQERLLQDLELLITKNQPTSDQLFRITIHVNETLPGARTSQLNLSLSVFMYDTESILPADGASIKTSPWVRVSDQAIPPRAKVNGAYVNSALAKQDAMDSGFDDALFLNQTGYVSELTAANIFLVKDGNLITPNTDSDILEGITRRSVIELAQQHGIGITERMVTREEINTADEVFACGTSAFVAPIVEIDGKSINDKSVGEITLKLKALLKNEQENTDSKFVTKILL